MFSDQDIKKALDKDIVIYPFNEEDLTPVGYNLNPSDFVLSLKSNEIIPQTKGYYMVPPHATVLILTKEAVWVSKKIAGTFHSKVGIVSAGFGHISTTLDPNWQGPLLISLNNPTDNELPLPANKSFVTLIFYKVRTPAKKDHDNIANRLDILKGISDKVLDDKLTEKSKIFLRKMQDIIVKQDTYDEFTRKYNELSQKSRRYIKIGLKKHNTASIINKVKYAGMIFIIVALVLLLLLKLYSEFVYNIPLGDIIDKSSFLAIAALLLTALPLAKTAREEIK